MKNVTIIVLAAVAILFVVLYSSQTKLINQLRKTIDNNNELIEKLKYQRDDYKAELDELESRPKPDETELQDAYDALIKQNKELKAKLADMESSQGEDEEEPAMAEDETPEEETETAVAEEPAEGGEAMADMISEMMKNPEMKKMMREQQKLAMDMMYGDLFEGLDLSPEALDKFKDLLADKQMANIELGLPRMLGNLDETETNELKTKLEEQQQKLDDDIMGLLGEAGFQDYQDYNKSISDRMTLGQFKNRLEGSGLNPLETHQEDELLTMIREEREAFQFSTNFGDPNNMDMGRFTEENLKNYFAERQQLYDKVIERSRMTLSEDQYNEFKSTVENQLQMEKVQMEMAARMFGSRGNIKKDSTETTEPVTPDVIEDTPETNE